MDNKKLSDSIPHDSTPLSNQKPTWLTRSSTDRSLKRLTGLINCNQTKPANERSWSVFRVTNQRRGEISRSLFYSLFHPSFQSVKSQLVGERRLGEWACWALVSVQGGSSSFVRAPCSPSRNSPSLFHSWLLLCLLISCAYTCFLCAQVNAIADAQIQLSHVATV